LLKQGEIPGDMSRGEKNDKGSKKHGRNKGTVGGKKKRPERIADVVGGPQFRAKLEGQQL